MLLWLAACQPGKTGLGDAPPAPPPPELTGPAAIDPVRGEPQTWTVSGTDAAVELRDPSGDVLGSFAAGEAVTWDARDDAGEPVATGTYTLAPEGGDPVDVEVVRVGLVAGTLGGPDRVPLCWWASAYWDDAAEGPTFSVASYDLTVAEPWSGVDEAPVDLAGVNLPAAFPFDAMPTLAVTLGGDAPAGLLTLELDGWDAGDADAVPNAAVTLTRTSPLSDGPGVVEETLAVRWMAGEDEVARQDVPIRVYATLGAATFEPAESPNIPWVAVLDPLLRELAGTAPTAEAVGGAIVDYVWSQEDLTYDTRYGASAYTAYRGGGFDRAVLDLSGFLTRENGRVVNCTDSAAIVEAYGHMVGVDFSYVILTPEFDLNYILAIGGTDFTHCPFGSGGCGFSYHTMVTPDDSATIYDATLQLDGDADPGSTPHTALPVRGLTGDDYRDALVMAGRPNYRYAQKGRIR